MDDLITQAKTDIAEILSTYSDWSHKFKGGDVSLSVHMDLIEFVNSRMETVDSCRILLENERVADVLGLNRSLLENYLLFILMCRGKKYFRLRAVKRSEKLQEIIDSERKSIGVNSLVAVEEHPTLKRHIMYVFEGLKSSSDSSEFIPYHFFLAQKFNPEGKYLDDGQYFTYLDRGDEGKQRVEQYRQEQDFIHRHYLSYQALLDCLCINDIADEAILPRIKAHYTYLGRFLHPTHEAFRTLRTKNNWHSGMRTMIGTEYPYEQSATLLAYCYTIHNAIGFLEELAEVLDNAPAENFKDSGSEDIHKVIAAMKQRYPYFWYIFNDAPDYAKFNYCIYQMPRDEFDAIGNDYRRVDPSIVAFNKDIYGSFSKSMIQQSTTGAGVYHPPYAK